MKKNDLVILVTGLNDFDWSKIVNKKWSKFGIEVITFVSRWKSQESYQKKLKRLLNLIDEKYKTNNISLIGVSAGGSLVINVFDERKNKINKVITVCSRLKKGKESGFRGFVKRTNKSLSFTESVLNSEKNINNFSLEEKGKIMTIHALFVDELIPKNTAIVNGSKNIVAPTIGHLVNIWIGLNWYSKTIRNFIEER